MSQSAYIRFVNGSAVEQLTLDGVKERLGRYREQTTLTGRQLDWEYADAAFPYTIETKPGEEDRWFYLKGADPLYRYLVIGVDQTEENGKDVHFVQVVLPDDATHGDKAKGNEFCKYLAKHLQAELKMFNGRTIYYNPRK
ncbi:hypothetical protein BG53_02200 [Paenibacillus darwinianus]|uniref:DUF1885 family protein n=1 Tax=Paenibacillus darwinianus TaxID=1380763 RepID=A0A9W5S158_9BACL|nr:DUF1885 family protein [Paenibacillus darwinianus]EXX85569.1 hypothetical protein BG52_08155 [Paenibacillus darwinianus]EXX88307.1 hypothetical protein BG53_02200 [Paenibacillus darwinianus]EXX89840.1 hypothetical protein CH50_00715 [Paenibacillus darwinianus]